MGAEKVSGTVFLDMGGRNLIICGHGTTAASRRGRVRVPRAEPRQCTDDDLCGRWRLRGIREGARGGGRTERDAAVGLLPAAQPLAPRGLAAKERRAVAVRGLVDTHAHPALACLPPLDRFGTRVPGPLQVVPGGGGRAFLYGRPLRRAERACVRTWSRRAEEWRWGSLYRWLRGSAEDRALLATWPRPRKASWVEHVNAPQTEAELAAVRSSVQRGSPFGNDAWTERTIRRLGLESTIRAQGRPKKHKNGS